MGQPSASEKGRPAKRWGFKNNFIFFEITTKKPVTQLTFIQMTKTTANKSTTTAKKPAASTQAKKTAPSKPAAAEKKKAPASKSNATKSTKAPKPELKKTAGKAVAKKVSKPKSANSAIQRPTRSRTAYMMFVKDVRTKTQNENPQLGFVDVTKEVANRWQALSAREKKPFEDRAAKDKARYESDVAKFRESYPDEPLTIKKKKRVPKLKEPKKVRSAYVYYTKEQRPKLKEAHPDLDFGQLTQHVAEGWNKLTDAQKAKYEALSTEDRVRFEEEHKAFNEEHPEVARRKKKARKNAPKKARSAYLYYTKDIRPTIAKSNPELGFGDLTKLVAEQWAKLSDAQKKKYEKLAADDRKRFESEMESYTPPTDEELDADEDGKRKRKHKTGPTRARTAYVYFTMDRRPEVQQANPEMKFGEITKILAAEWGKLSDAAKGKYNEQHDADKVRYENEVAAAGN